MTVLDLLTKSLAELNITDAGTAATADDVTFAFGILNDWIDALATEGLTIFQVTRSTWTLTGAASYTIGIGGVINTARPTSPQAIVNIGYQDTSVSPTQEVLFGAPLTIQAYAGVPQKAATAVTPTSFYYNPTFGSTGFGTIWPFPISTSTTLQGVIYVPTPVTEFAATSDTVSLPPGYRRFLRTNLAVELAGAFQIQMPEGLEERAREAKANIKRANSRLADMSLGIGGGAYSIWTDTVEV